MSHDPDQLLAESRVVHDAQAVSKAVHQTAVRIDLDLRGENPIFMPVLQGGLYFAGALLPLLRFPMQQASVHVSRYTEGLPGDLMWHARPKLPVEGRTVLLVDDVFDEGLTLAALVRELQEQGAKRVASAVLAEKLVPKKTDYRPDYIALECGDEYLFGCGMDVHSYWRNLPEVRAVDAT